MRLVAEDLALEGDPARNLATFVTTWMEPEAQRIIADEPAPQLHRPRRVPAHGGDRAALHPDARRPVPRAGRDHRGAHPGIVRGDHARRAVAEVELAQPPAGGRPADDEPEPGVRRRRARGVGEVLPLLRRRAADRAAAAGQVHDRPGRRRARTSTRTPSASRPCSAPRSPATRTTSSASTTCSCGSRRSGDSMSRCTSTAPAAASSGRSSTPTRRGTSGSSRCARSTSPGTSSGWSTPASAG